MGLAAVLGALAGSAVLLSGAYNTAATKQHFALTHWLLERGLRFSVGAASDHIVVPPLEEPALSVRGASCYQSHCAQCHGAPGIAPAAYALGLLPVPTGLAQASRDWSARELYWIVSKGVRMTGMPAWEYRLSEESRWATVAFLQRMPLLTRADYAALLAQSADERTDQSTHDSKGEIDGDASGSCPRALDMTDVAPEEDPESDPRRVVLRQYGCQACHRFEGLVGPTLTIGPPIENWSERRFIAGTLPNTRENLERWLRDPQAVRPGTLMPDLSVTEAHAREIASYIFAPEQP